MVAPASAACKAVQTASRSLTRFSPRFQAVPLLRAIQAARHKTHLLALGGSASMSNHGLTSTTQASGAPAPAHTTGSGGTLLVFDFDWSLIEENSDTFVINQLGADSIYKAGKAAGMPWTQLMDHTLQEAARQLGRTPADVRAALHRTLLHPALAEVVRQAAAAGSDMAVVSDANTVYIDTILEQHGLRQLVLEVHTNPAEWRDGALRVAPYHTQPHGCRHCPSNLCKGKVLLEFLERQYMRRGQRYDRVLYVGDGRGDYCPSVLLLHGHYPAAPAAAAAVAAAGVQRAAAPASTHSSGSSSGGKEHLPAPSSTTVFARNEYPDGLPCSLWVMLRTEVGSSGGSSTGSQGQHAPGSAEAAPPGSTAPAGGRVVPWSRPEQLAALLTEELQLAS